MVCNWSKTLTPRLVGNAGQTKTLWEANFVSSFSLAQTVVDQNVLNRTYEIIEPLNNDHLQIAAKIGAKIGSGIHGTLINRPTGGDVDEDGKLWIASYQSQLHRLNDSFEVDFTPNIAFQPPASGDGIGYLLDMSLTKDGSRLILATSYGHHCVKVYNRDTGALISTIGVPNSRGDLIDGKLWNPHSACRLANGNVVVSGYNGKGPNSTRSGTISEWDVSTPIATLVATRLEYSDDGLSAVGASKINQPMRMIWNAGRTHLWTVEYNTGKILRIDPATWQVSDVIQTPTGFTTIRNSYGLAEMSDGTIVIASNAAKMIIGIDPVSKSVAFTIDPELYGGTNNAMRGVFEIEPGYLAWSDYTQSKMFAVCTGEVVIPYQQPSIPAGWEIHPGQLAPHIDPATWTATVSPYEIADKSGPEEVLLRKSA